MDILMTWLAAAGVVAMMILIATLLLLKRFDKEQEQADEP